MYISNYSFTFATSKRNKMKTLNYNQKWSNLEKMPLTFNYLINELDMKEYYDLLDILFEDEKDIVTPMIEQMKDEELLTYLKSLN